MACPTTGGMSGFIIVVGPTFGGVSSDVTSSKSYTYFERDTVDTSFCKGQFSRNEA